MQIEHWPIDPELKREAEQNYRTKFALNLKNSEPMSIIRELTFDGVVPNITVKDIEELFTYIERHFLKKLLEGIGLEVGAGSLTFSSILARRPAVEKIYGVEICQPIVEYLAPKIISHVLGDHTDKVSVQSVVSMISNWRMPQLILFLIFFRYTIHQILT
mgnify:CR=1 FL=1